MKKIGIFVVAVAMATCLSAQKYFTKGATISFHSDTPMEKIEAVNNQVVCVLDSENGRMQWSALIKAFNFEKALMQEHFNENYMESETYPKATFAGQISEGEVNWDKAGEYNVTVSGVLAIHGVKNDVEVDGKVLISESGLPSVSSEFSVLVADYDIEVPKVVRENIAKEVRIFVNGDLDVLD